MHSASEGSPKRGPKFKWIYSLQLAEQICCAMVEHGLSLGAVSKLPNMPSLFTISRMRWENPSFNRMIAQAREDRRDFFLDEIFDLVESLGSGNPLLLLRFKKKLGYLKWASQIKDPGSFGRRRTHLGFQIQTWRGVITIKPRR